MKIEYKKNILSSGLRSDYNVTSVHLITMICKFGKTTSDSEILYRVHDVSHVSVYMLKTKQNEAIERLFDVYSTPICGSEAGALIINSSRDEGSGYT